MKLLVACENMRRFPAALSMFREVVLDGDQPVPDACFLLARRILELEGARLLCDSQKRPKRSPYRTALNRTLRQLRKAQPTAFETVSSWLDSPQARWAFGRVGGSYARQQMQAAVLSILQGEQPHIALEMHRGGKPDGIGFSNAFDGAVLACHLQEQQGMSATEAKHRAAELVCLDDPRAIEFERTKFRFTFGPAARAKPEMRPVITMSVADVHVIAVKYGFRLDELLGG